MVTLAAVGSLNFSSPFGFEQGRSSILFDGGGSFGGFIDAGARDAAGPVRIESANGGLSVDAVLKVVGALALLTLDQASSIDVTGPVSVDEGGTLAAIGNVDVAGPVDIADGTVDVSQSTGGLDQGVRIRRRGRTRRAPCLEQAYSGRFQGRGYDHGGRRGCWPSIPAGGGVEYDLAPRQHGRDYLCRGYGSGDDLHRGSGREREHGHHDNGGARGPRRLLGRNHWGVRLAWVERGRGRRAGVFALVLSGGER